MCIRDSFTPLTWLFSQWKRLLGHFVHSTEEDTITEGELVTMVSEAEKDGELTDRESELIRSAIEFDDVEVEEILTPRVDVIAVEDDLPLEEVAQTFAESGYSRLPVYHDTIDNIIGVLIVKDLLALVGAEHVEHFNIQHFMREVLYVPETAKCKNVLTDMTRHNAQMAIAVDEYGGTVGIVTIEDLIEEVFGDIEDEYDDENKEIEVIKEDEYIVDGSAKLDVVSELIGVNMESEEFDSVGGLIIGELGRFPEQDEEIVLNNIKFKVEEIDKNRVKKVRIFT